MRKPEQNRPTMDDLKRAGVLKAIEAAQDGEWLNRAVLAVRAYARFNALFLCEDVTHWATATLDLPVSPEPRSWGAVMLAAWKAGYVSPSDNYATTQYGEGNKRGMRLWMAK